MRILAIDPGHTCGLATLRIRDDGVLGIPYDHQVQSVRPGHVYHLLETEEFDVVVAEEFRLYPWLATHQAFSELKTVRVLGVIEWLAAKRGFPFYEQRADIKKEARSLAEDHGWPMEVRTLGSGKGKYRGPDFAYKGQQHGRDALAHGVYWVWRNPSSPLYN